MENIDATGKLATNLGITTEKLIGLRHAANIAGVDAAALDKSLAMFVRRLGEVKMGTGEAKQGLELLGLKADDLINKSPAESLGVVADKINQLENAAMKGQAAYLLFGRSGQQLLNMFASGSEGLAAMQKEAERLGLTFSIIDYAKVAAANDAFARLKAVITGVAQSLTIELAPILEAVSVKLVDMSTKGESAGERMRAVFAKVGRTLAIIGDIFTGIKGVIQAIIGAVQGALGIALKGLLYPVQKLLGTFESINNKIANTKIGKKLGMKILNFDDIRENIKGAARTFDDAAKKNLLAGGKNVKDAFFGEGLKKYDALLADAEKRAEAIRDKLSTTPSGLPAIDETKKEKFDPGKFETIRSAFVDVAALSGSVGDPQLDTLHEQLNEARRGNELLERLVQQDMGVVMA